jgi:hypothetical protein
MKMKTGVIVYILGGDGAYDGYEVKEAVKKLNIKADRVEIVSSRLGHFDVMDAWWMLTAKAMHRIVCMLAEICNDSNLKLTGRNLRLCG